MTLLELTTGPSLISLPLEIHKSITSHLDLLDRATFKLTCRHFHSLIPRLTHVELLAVEPATFRFLACVGCTSLRPFTMFSSMMIKHKKVPGGVLAHNRFCLECGRRPLPGAHRYTLGSRWEEQGMTFVRCLRCRRIARSPEDKAVGLCLSCHGRDLEEATAMQDQGGVWSRVAEQQERSLLRAERKRNWITSGRALSD